MNDQLSSAAASATLAQRFVICVNNESNPVHLTLYKVYRVIPSKKADKLGLIRLVDDSGEDYAYPAPMFRPIELSAEVQEMFVGEVA
jgi:hypothetical protein